MYKNIGGKIKGLAQALCIVGMFFSFLFGFLYLANGINFLSKDDFGWNLVIIGSAGIILGPILSWISTWPLYGFGELIDKTTKIAENTEGKKDKSDQEYQDIASYKA